MSMYIHYEVLRLLNDQKFCFLGTSHREKPHLSMMNFTYCHEERIIILSSRKDTEKVTQISNNPNVSILLHNLSDDPESPLSCTIDGYAEILEPGKDIKFREKHYRKNSDMSGFIIGENIAVIKIEIKHILVSDSHDRVWEYPAEEFYSLTS